MNNYQRTLMEHSLGGQDPKKWHRNHFMASPGHQDLADLLELKEQGMMTQLKTPSFCDPDSMLFAVTNAGKQFLTNIDELKIGDSVIFDNGTTPPETIIIERFDWCWQAGTKIKTARYKSSDYDLVYLKKRDTEGDRHPPRRGDGISAANRDAQEDNTERRTT